MKTYNSKECAVLIREALKQAFPRTKFSVRVHHRNSINADWTDGPTGKQVKVILDRFDGQGFDGMTDCSYLCGERMFRGEPVNFYSGYVFGNRHASQELARKVADRVCYECGCAVPTVNEYGCCIDCHDVHVPFQWRSCWHDEKPLTLAELEASGHILTHDDNPRDHNAGEWLGTLIDRITQNVSLEDQQPVDLPEYIDVKAKAETGRAPLEEKQPKFAGHTEHDKEAQAIREFEHGLTVM